MINLYCANSTSYYGPTITDNTSDATTSSARVQGNYCARLLLCIIFNSLQEGQEVIFGMKLDGHFKVGTRVKILKLKDLNTKVRTQLYIHD